MKRLIVVFLCLLAAACGTPAPATPAPAPTDESQVRAAFETYTKAGVAKDGDTAVPVMANSYLAMYDNARKLALTGTEQQVAAVPVSRRGFVYALRRDVDAATLRTASPQELAKISVENGLVNEQAAANVKIGAVTVSGDTASAEVIAKGEVAPYRYSFVREEGAWKLDPKPMFDLADAAMADIAAKKNTTPDQMFEQAMIAKYGAAKVAELHKPVGG
ncbi:hypothetical protein ACWGE0_21895 [Lentzea sp. NPDC054927]